MTGKTDIQILKDFLQQQGLRSDDRLPPERLLAERLGMTRSRLRTSLAKLEKEGLIRRHVGQGTYLSAPPLSAASAAIHFPEVDTSPAEILETRLALEPQIAHLAALRATGQDIDRLREIVIKAREAISWEEWNSLDKKFHRTLAQLAGNRLLLTLLEAIHASLTLRNWGTLSETSAAVARRDAATLEHEVIIAAIAARDPKGAALAMRAHLTAVRNTLLGQAEAL